jgi:hypothetical protein
VSFEKNMNKPIIIEELGKIWGRDAIFLDGIEFDGTHSVRLIGDFNGSLCENIKNEKWISYELTFKGILEFKITELDFFSNTEYTSSFEKVIDSDTVNRFAKSSQNFKLNDSHQHYIFHTYDDVIELVASDFELKLKPKKKKIKCLNQ